MCQIIEEIDLMDTRTHDHRFLVVGRCRNPKCGVLRAQLIAYDKVQQKFISHSFKSKDVKRIIDEFKSNPFLDLRPVNDTLGTFANQNWIYGLTKNRKENGQMYIEHWACNFNGEKTLINKRMIDEPTNLYAVSH